MTDEGSPECSLAPSNDEPTLRGWLKDRGINVDVYGTGNAKPVGRLLIELQEGECTLEEIRESNRPAVVRRTASAWVMLRCNGRCLIECHQVFADGRVRDRKTKNGRGLPVAEKLKPGESWEVAAMRGLREELGVGSEAVRLHSFANMELETLESGSYPGIITEYCTWHTDADLLPELLSEDERVRLAVSSHSCNAGVLLDQDHETFSTFETDSNGNVNETVWAWEATSEWLAMEDPLDDVGMNHFNFESRINAIQFSPIDTNVVATALDNGTVRIGNLARPANTIEILFSSTRANCVAISPAGRYIAVGGGRLAATDEPSSSTKKRYGVRIYRLGDRHHIAELHTDDTVNDVAFAQGLREENEHHVTFGSDAKSYSSATLSFVKWGVGGGDQSMARVLDPPYFSKELHDNQWLRTADQQDADDAAPTAETVFSSQLSPSGHHLACLTKSGKLVVWEKMETASAWERLPRYPIHEARVRNRCPPNLPTRFTTRSSPPLIFCAVFIMCHPPLFSL